jgi:hypothetical protein
MTEKEQTIYNNLLKAFMSADEYISKEKAANGQLRAVVIGMRNTALSRDARMKRLEAANNPKPKRSRKKKTDDNI